MTQLGQQTGGDPRDEALRLLDMMKTVDYAAYLNTRDEEFLSEQYDRLASNGVAAYSASGKQLFWLRDIKDKLVNCGAL
jgi:hypothetical protein